MLCPENFNGKIRGKHSGSRRRPRPICPNGMPYRKHLRGHKTASGGRGQRKKGLSKGGCPATTSRNGSPPRGRASRNLGDAESEPPAAARTPPFRGTREILTQTRTFPGGGRPLYLLLRPRTPDGPFEARAEREPLCAESSGNILRPGEARMASHVPNRARGWHARYALCSCFSPQRTSR
jgi:hypothetical protein